MQFKSIPIKISEYKFILYSWFKEDHHHLLNPLPPRDPRFFQFGGALEIRGAKKEDEGNYRYANIKASKPLICLPKIWFILKKYNESVKYDIESNSTL